MTETIPVVSKTDKGVQFTVESGLLDKDTRLKKSRLGGFHYNCPFCSAHNKLDLNDVRLAFMAKKGPMDLDPLWQIQRYSAIAEDLQRLEKTADFISYLIKKVEVYKAHKDGYKHVRQSSSVSMELKCTLCGKPTVFNVKAEAEVKAAPIPFDWVQPTGELLSESQGQEMAELFWVDDYDTSEPGSSFMRLPEARELMEAYESRPLTWKGHEKILWKINWDDVKGRQAPECAAEFLQRLLDIRGDMEKTPLIAERLREVNDAILVHAFKTTGIQVYAQTLVSSLDPTTVEKNLLRKLRRQLAENLLWLQDEVNKLVTTGKLDLGSSR